MEMCCVFFESQNKCNYIQAHFKIILTLDKLVINSEKYFDYKIMFFYFFLFFNTQIFLIEIFLNMQKIKPNVNYMSTKIASNTDFS